MITNDSDSLAILEGVGTSTAYKDNTRSDRLKALSMLASTPEEMAEAMEMLGIKPEWLAEDFQPPTPHQPHWRMRRGLPKAGPVSM